MNELVYLGANHQAVTTSVLVAKEFEKTHKSVIHSIENLIKGSAQNYSDNLMFEKSVYYDTHNRPQPMYIMNRDGFTLLAMSFTGQKATQFKMNYIRAFNAMEQHIKEEESKPREIQPMSQAQLLLQSAQLLVDIENRQKETEQRTLALEEKVQAIEDRRQEAEKELFDAPLSDVEVPEISLRTRINDLVAKYAESENIEYRLAWRKVYDEMRQRYHVIFSENKEQGYRKIDDAERRGFLPYMYNIISHLIKNRKNVSNSNSDS